MIVVLGRTDDGVGGNGNGVGGSRTDGGGGAAVVGRETQGRETVVTNPYFAPRPPLFMLPLLQEQHNNNVRRRARDLCCVNFPALLIRPKDLG